VTAERGSAGVPVLPSLIAGSRGSHQHLIHVTPAPIFSGLEGLDNRVLSGVEVLGRMAVGARIAATYVPADEALA